VVPNVVFMSLHFQESNTPLKMKTLHLS